MVRHVSYPVLPDHLAEESWWNERDPLKYGELRAQTRVNAIVKFANGSSYTRRPVTNVHQQTGVKPCIRLTANYRVCRWMLACSNATRCLQWRIKNFNDTNIISNLRYHNINYCRSIDKFDFWFLIYSNTECWYRLSRYLWIFK